MLDGDLLILHYLSFKDYAYEELRKAYDESSLTYEEISDRLFFDVEYTKKVLNGTASFRMDDYSAIARAMGYRISLKLENLQELGIKDDR